MEKLIYKSYILNCGTRLRKSPLGRMLGGPQSQCEHWEREKSLILVRKGGYQNPDSSVIQLVAWLPLSVLSKLPNVIDKVRKVNYYVKYL